MLELYYRFEINRLTVCYLLERKATLLLLREEESQYVHFKHKFDLIPQFRHD